MVTSSIKPCVYPSVVKFLPMLVWLADVVLSVFVVELEDSNLPSIQTDTSVPFHLPQRKYQFPVAIVDEPVPLLDPLTVKAVKNCGLPDDKP